MSEEGCLVFFCLAVRWQGASLREHATKKFLHTLISAVGLPCVLCLEVDECQPPSPASSQFAQVVKGVGPRSTARKVRMGSKPMAGRGRAWCLKGAWCCCLEVDECQLPAPASSQFAQVV